MLCVKGTKMKKISLPQDDDELLAECRVTAFRSSGSGGQHVNTTDSAVRLTHLPTGIVVTSQKERSQYLNKRECILKLRQKVEILNYRKPYRIATRVPKSAIIKNQEKKVRQSHKKKLRRTPRESD